MAEGPKIMRNDDGLFVRCEFDVHYISDEDAQRIRGYIDQLKAENTKLLEQMERLVTLLRVDCDIDASWDGLRRFWSIGLTEGGCLMRDRACKAEAENAKLRELVQDIYGVMWACAEQRCTHRHDGCFRVHGNHGDICVSERCWYEDRMSELGIEV